MRDATYTTGYSLVEVLVSIAILLLAIVGPLTIAAEGIRSARFALEQNTAYFLAQEGIEHFIAYRGNQKLRELDGNISDDWDWTTDGSLGGCVLNSDGDVCDVGIFLDGNSPFLIANHQIIDCNTDVTNCRITRDETNNRSIFAHGSGEDTQFTRVISITRISADAIKIDSIVSWDSTLFTTPRTVAETTFLYNFDFI